MAEGDFPDFSLRLSIHDTDVVIPDVDFLDVIARISPGTLQSTALSKEWICDRNGLLIDGHRFDPDIARLVPRIFKDDYGSALFYQPILEEYPPKYWQAQGLLRGFTSKTIISLLDEIKSNSQAPMAKKIELIQAGAVTIVRKREDDERERRWQLLTNSQKARINAQRFVKEWADSGTGDTVTLKLSNRRPLKKAVIEFNLHYKDTASPYEFDDRQHPIFLPIRRWSVIGTTPDAVQHRIFEIDTESGHREEKNRVKFYLRKKQVWLDRMRSDIMDGYRPDQATEEGTPFDIMGKWTITGDLIDVISPNEPCILYIRHHVDDDGSAYMWADFDFNVISGLFRFETPDLPVEDLLQAARERDAEDGTDDGSDDDVTMEDYGSVSNYSDEDLEDNETTDNRRNIFYIGHKIKPSTTRPVWDFHWRGVSIYSNGAIPETKRQRSTLRFLSGGKLEGVFASTTTGDFHFEGNKILFRRGRLNPLFNDSPRVAQRWKELA